jgi:hypothetical protein
MLRRYRWLGIALALIILCGAVLMLYQRFIVAPATSRFTRLMPLLSDLGLYAAIALLPVSLALLVLLVLRARGVVDTRTLRRRVLSTLLATLIASSICAATALGLLVTHPDFPLGPTLVASEPSPDGKQVAYLYRYFLSGFLVFKRQAGQVTLRHHDVVRTPVYAATLRLRWVADGTVRIAGPGVRPRNSSFDPR